MKPNKVQQRKKRQNKIRAKVSGTASCPRLSVSRSLTNIYAQLIDDKKGIVLVSASSLKVKKDKGVETAKQVGLDIAKKASEKKLKNCVFDRGGNLYHGRIKALAEGAREGGLKF